MSVLGAFFSTSMYIQRVFLSLHSCLSLMMESGFKKYLRERVSRKKTSF